MKIYVASSWRNNIQPLVVEALRKAGHEVYDFKNPEPGNHGFHWEEIDANWTAWSSEQFRQALSHPIAESGFGLDMKALKECDACVMVLSCGRSAHLEAGYAIGAGKPTVIMLENGEPELMYKMTPYICLDIQEVVECIDTINQNKSQGDGEKMTQVNRKGIDVSVHQGVIDWDKVKAAGIEFAMLRAGYGNNNIDGQFKRNISECNRVGIPCGVYWFSYALNAEQAAREAQQCIAAIKPYRVEYPVCFDLEYDTVRYAKDNGVTIGKALATAFVKAFCTEVEKAGYYAANYTNQDYSRNMFDMDALSCFDLWYAWYNANCNRSDAGLWQYTSSGKVPGIGGNVDSNIAFKDYPAIIRGAGLNGFSKGETPAPSTPTPPAPTPTTPSAPGCDFVKGDKVKVANAIQYNGQPFTTYYDEYDVISVDGDRVVIGIGSTVTAAVKASNLAAL